MVNPLWPIPLVGTTPRLTPSPAPPIFGSIIPIKPTPEAAVELLAASGVRTARARAELLGALPSMKSAGTVPVCCAVPDGDR